MDLLQDASPWGGAEVEDVDVVTKPTKPSQPVSRQGICFI